MKTLVALIFSILLLFACGTQDRSDLNGILDYEDDEFRALLFDDENNRYIFGSCAGATELNKRSDCQEYKVIINYKSRSEFFDLLLRIVRENVLSLGNEFSFHVRASSEAILNTQLKDLGRIKKQLQEEKGRLEIKIAFLKEKGLDHEKPQADLAKTITQLTNVNDQLAKLHPSADSLATILNNFIDRITTEDFISRKHLVDQDMIDLYELATNYTPKEPGPISEFDKNTNEVWRMKLGKVSWYSARTDQSENSCERLYGEPWRTPSYNEWISSKPAPFFPIDKGRLSISQIATGNVILDWLAPEVRGEDRHLVCVAPIGEVYPKGDIDFDGLSNNEDRCYTRATEQGSTDVDCLPDLQDDLAEQKNVKEARYGSDPFLTNGSVLSATTTSVKKFGENQYFFLAQNAPTSIQEAKIFCSRMHSKLFSSQPSQVQLGWQNENRRMQAVFWRQDGLRISAQAGSTTRDFVRESISYAPETKKVVYGIGMAYGEPYEQANIYTTKQIGPNQLYISRQDLYRTGTPMGTPHSCKAYIWVSCTGPYRLDSSDWDLDTVPNTKDQCVNSMERPGPVDANGCANFEEKEI